ncbi:MAG: glycosyltransferase [Phycisphaerales bacterium]
MISYVLPTHNRPAVLAETLAALARLPRHDADVIIVDNASHPPASAPPTLTNGLAVDVLRLPHNRGTAARNAGAQRAADRRGGPAGHWLVMLDDDSAPTSTDFLPLLTHAHPSLAVLSAAVLLPPAPDNTTRHEAGGLPEVFIGCGAAIRADAFLTLGGYDPSFDYYAEEYDLSARFLLAGFRVAYDRRFTVLHRKVQHGRDMDRILANLVRNNAWVMARYAPPHLQSAQVQAQIDRYADIAAREGATAGYQRGLQHLQATLAAQPRRPLPEPAWLRFTGYAAARQHLASLPGSPSVCLVEPGKHAEVVRDAARDAGLRLTDSPADADALLIASLSPGPMLDAAARLRSHGRRVETPWALPG